MKKTVISEYVGLGHPDKVADQVSDALLDAFLEKDPMTRAGIEVMVKDNIVDYCLFKKMQNITAGYFFSLHDSVIFEQTGQLSGIIQFRFIQVEIPSGREDKFQKIAEI